MNILGLSELKISKLEIRISPLQLTDLCLLNLNFHIFTSHLMILILSPLKFIKFMINGTISERRNKSAETHIVSSNKNAQKLINKESISALIYMMVMTTLILPLTQMIYSCLELNSMMLKTLAILLFSKIQELSTTVLPQKHGTLEIFS